MMVRRLLVEFSATFFVLLQRTAGSVLVWGPVLKDLVFWLFDLSVVYVDFLILLAGIFVEFRGRLMLLTEIILVDACHVW
jgi:hypothetical protein